MLRKTVLFFTLMLVSLLAGRAFWAWVGENPAKYSDATYISFYQRLNKAIETPIAAIGTAAAIFALASALLNLHDRGTLYLFLGVFVCVLVSTTITLRVNVPINEQVATFNPARLPGNWPELRDHWWHWHLVRTAVLLTGMSLSFIATLIHGGDPH
jgi:uncharacterized membrane protein